MVFGWWNGRGGEGQGRRGEVVWEEDGLTWSRMRWLRRGSRDRSLR